MNRPAELALGWEGEVPVAVLQGEVDMANADGLRSSLLGAMSNRAPGLVVDLTGTTYLDSAGVHVVFDLARRLAARQQQLLLVVPRDAPIRRVLVLTSVSTVAQLHEDRNDAVRALRSAQGDERSAGGAR